MEFGLDWIGNVSYLAIDDEFGFTAPSVDENEHFEAALQKLIKILLRVSRYHRTRHILLTDIAIK